MKPTALFAASVALLAMSSLPASEIITANYGKLPDGREVRLFTLANGHGLQAQVLEYGAILASVSVPDPKGGRIELTLNCDSLASWLACPTYFGATVGRFANRIAHGKFTLDGHEYVLATNNSPGGIPCHLHGGVRGFDKVLWTGSPVQRPGARGVQFKYVSPDGDQGYPGTLTAKVTYWLTDVDEIIWETEATTDKPTIINLAQHTYWNLTGDPRQSINNHLLMLAADEFLPTDAGLIPTGARLPVAGTPMDFRQPTAIGARVEADFEALKLGGGYDHAWVLRAGSGIRQAAIVRDPVSGRSLEVLTNQPAVQFYGGNFLDGTFTGTGGVKFQKRTGLCLETEGFPDSPNKPQFPSPVLRPGQTYHHTEILRFKY